MNAGLLYAWGGIYRSNYRSDYAIQGPVDPVTGVHTGRRSLPVGGRLPTGPTRTKGEAMIQLSKPEFFMLAGAVILILITLIVSVGMLIDKVTKKKVE